MFIPSAGWGNVILRLSDLCFKHKNPVVHSSINIIKKGIEFHGFTITDEDLEETKTDIYINPYYYQMIHPLSRQIVKPTIEMQGLINKNMHLIGEAGIHIRRGAYSPDSFHVGKFPFCHDSALEKFKIIIKNSKSFIFLASDSVNLKNELVNEFPDKIKIVNVLSVMDSDDPVNSTNQQYMDCYLEWFLLSKCPKLYITGGNQSTGNEISTFGYSAAVYGNKPLEIIFN